MHTFFESTRPGVKASFGGAQFELPILYWRDDSFGGVFTADLNKLRELMPSDRLHPVPGFKGRGLVLIAGFDYFSTSIGPYGEVSVAVPVVYGRRPPPLLPSLLEARWPGAGYLVLYLPVTHRVARDAGRGQWGYAKFVADMDFENTPEHFQCRLEERDQHILSLRVAKRGMTFQDRRPIVTYSVRERALVKTTIPQITLARTAIRPKDSSLEIGDGHPMALALHALDLDPKPVMTRYFVDRCAILPAGEVVEENVRPLEGYLGENREQGALNTRAPLPGVTH